MCVCVWFLFCKNFTHDQAQVRHTRVPPPSTSHVSIPTPTSVLAPNPAAQCSLIMRFYNAHKAPSLRCTLERVVWLGVSGEAWNAVGGHDCELFYSSTFSRVVLRVCCHRSTCLRRRRRTDSAPTTSLRFRTSRYAARHTHHRFFSLVARFLGSVCVSGPTFCFRPGAVVVYQEITSSYSLAMLAM